MKTTFSVSVGKHARANFRRFILPATFFGVFCAAKTFAQIQVFVPAQTQLVQGPPVTTTVTVPPVYETHTVPAVTHTEIVPAVTHQVQHPAVTHVEHHDAVTHNVHHDAVIGEHHYDAVTHVEHHPASTHWESVPGYWSSNWVPGYWDSVWVDGYLVSEYVDCGYYYYYVDGYMEDVWVQGYWDNAWVDGYDYEVTDNGPYDETVTDEPEHTDYYVITPESDETVVDQAAWDETVTDQAAWVETVVDVAAHPVEIVDEPEHSVTVMVQEGHTETVTTPGPWITVVVVPAYWRNMSFVGHSTGTQDVGRSYWYDVNGDGILDEIVFLGSDRFGMTLTNCFWTPNQPITSATFDILSAFDSWLLSGEPSQSWQNWTLNPITDAWTNWLSFNLDFGFDVENGYDYRIYTVRDGVDLAQGIDLSHWNIWDIISAGPESHRIKSYPGTGIASLLGLRFALVRLGKAPVSPNWTLEGIAADPDPIRYYMADRPRFLSLVPNWDWDNAISRNIWGADVNITDPVGKQYWEIAEVGTTVLPPETPLRPLPDTLPPEAEPTPYDISVPTVRANALLALVIFEEIVQKIRFSYVLYEKPHKTLPGKWYSGRTGPWIGNPTQVLTKRDATHDRNIDHGPAVLVAYVQTRGLVTRAAYAMRGREQQLIDSHGGYIAPVNGVAAYQLGLTNSTNSRREVATYNEEGYSYWLTSNFMFGPLALYSGADWTRFFGFVTPLWPTGGQIIKVTPPTPLYPFAP